MPGPPVSLRATVMLMPGITTIPIPDFGTIVFIPPPYVLASGQPLATVGSTCLMINTLTGLPYPLTIGQPGSTGVRISGSGLLRVGDQIPTPPGTLTILGPPVTTSIIDTWI